MKKLLDKIVKEINKGKKPSAIKVSSQLYAELKSIEAALPVLAGLSVDTRQKKYPTMYGIRGIPVIADTEMKKDFEFIMDAA